MIKVIGIKITDRIKEVGLTQEILSKHASIITTRLGFHELTTELCSREAYVVLHLNGKQSDFERLVRDLEGIGGVEIRSMDFHDKTRVSAGNNGQTVILGLLVEQDHDLVVAVQKLLTSYGCVIRARLGVNETFFGKPAGLILLELSGDKDQITLLEKDLRNLKKVHLRKIVF